MSRDSDLVQVLHVGFPRVSGDEPIFEVYANNSNGFSPRERG